MLHLVKACTIRICDLELLRYAYVRIHPVSPAALESHCLREDLRRITTAERWLSWNSLFTGMLWALDRTQSSVYRLMSAMNFGNHKIFVCSLDNRNRYVTGDTSFRFPSLWQTLGERVEILEQGT